MGDLGGSRDGRKAIPMVTTSQAASRRDTAANNEPDEVDTTGGREVLERVRCGDRAAFEELFLSHHGLVFSVAVGVLRDPAQAQEVAQEVFLQLWQQAPRFDPALGSATAWVKRVARCRAIDRVRSCENAGARDTRYAAAQHIVDSDTVIEQVLHGQEQVRVREALQRLTPQQRQSIVLAYYAGMTTTEIADQLGVNRSTIKSRIRDGLRRLTAVLQNGPETLAS